MKVDIVIPAYRAAKFVKDSIQSILFQKRLDPCVSIRVVVVCDGCEETYQVAKGFASENVLVVLSSENAGAYNAMNCGLALCRIECDLVGTQGADDIMHAMRMSHTLQMYRGFRNKTVAFNCRSNRIDENGNVLTRLGLNPSNSGTYIYTSNVLREIGMYKPWWCGADNEYRERFYRIGGHVRQAPKLLHSYRKHPNQLTSHPSTVRGTKERDFSYDEIERLKREGFEPLFQNHPTTEIVEQSGVELPIDKLYKGFFDSKDLTK